MSEPNDASDPPKPKAVPPRSEPRTERGTSTENLLAEELGGEPNRRDFLQKAGSVVIGGVIVAVGAALFITIGTDVKNGITALDNATSGIPAP